MFAVVTDTSGIRALLCLFGLLQQAIFGLNEWQRKNLLCSTGSDYGQRKYRRSISKAHTHATSLPLDLHIRFRLAT